MRLSAIRCSSSRAPSTTRGLGVDGEVMVVGERAELGRGVHEGLPEVGRAVRLVAVRVRPGEQEQVADEPAHALRGAQGRVRGLAALAVEDLDEQLEVGEDARERGAQLVRRVRDELALALERLLRLVARCLEAVEHVLERPSQLGDLVVGRGLRERRAGVAGLRDVARAGREGGDRRHRAAADDQPAEEGEERAAEHAAGEEQPDALDGGLDDRGLAAVLDDDRRDERPLRVLDRDVAERVSTR